MTTVPCDPKNDREVVSSMLAEITRSEQHFNTLETEYRKLTSSWLLAAFAAMGYVATAKELPVPAGTTIFLIGVAASVGIQLLWIVDLMAYHQLLLANFLEGLRLERANPDLPQVRGNMVAHGSTGKLVRLFYLGSALAPLALGVAAFFSINHPQDALVYDVVVLLIAAGLLTSCTIWMIKSPGRWVRVQVAALDAKIPPSPTMHNPFEQLDQARETSA